jgi:molecular chaperone GrpE
MTDPTATPEPANDDAPAGAAPAQAPTDPVETLTRETADLKDKLLRALAEMENVRRRSERDVADARTYGITGFARDVLGVADNMHRAIEAIGAELRAGADDGVKSLIEGIELTERELLKVMEKHGVKRFDPQGEKFDPNLHQAMYEVPDASVAPGTVVQVMQAGYKLGDRVLRPAMVGVAKGGPKPGNGGEAAPESTQQGTA